MEFKSIILKPSEAKMLADVLDTPKNLGWTPQGQPMTEGVNTDTSRRIKTLRDAIRAEIKDYLASYDATDLVALEASEAETVSIIVPESDRMFISDRFDNRTDLIVSGGMRDMVVAISDAIRDAKPVEVQPVSKSPDNGKVVELHPAKV